jgi:hypothetical protein
MGLITTANRPKMGDEAYHLGAGADVSGTSVKPGMVVPRRAGAATNDVSPDAGDATHRGPIMAQSLGAQFRITATRGPWSETNSAVLANGRIMPATTGSVRNFRSAQMYGSQGD